MTLSCLCSLLLYCGVCYISHTSVTFPLSKLPDLIRNKILQLCFIVHVISAQAGKDLIVLVTVCTTIQH